MHVYTYALAPNTICFIAKSAFSWVVEKPGNLPSLAHHFP